MQKATRLENGLTLVTSEMPHMASVSVGIWVGAGSRHEPAAVNGVSHFIEHLLFKGTKRRTAEEISQAVEGAGGYLNAFTGEEHTCYYAKARYDQFGRVLDVLSDMFLNSTFDRGEIRKERDVIKEELAMYLDQPHQHVQELLNATLWPDQPLGRSITGTVQSLDAMTRDDLTGYLSAKYVTDATVIAAAGRITHAQALKAVRPLARRFTRGRRAGHTPAIASQLKPVICLHTKETEQTQLALGIRGVSRHDPRRFAVRVLNAILGENMSSRLFQTVREDHGLAYSIQSGASFFDDTGDLAISAGLDLGQLQKTLRLILRELKRMATQPVPQGELRRATDYLAGQMDLSLENSENQMMWAGENWLNYGKVIQPEQSKSRLRRVTAAEVRTVAAELFRPDRYNLALVSPLKSDRGLASMLAA